MKLFFLILSLFVAAVVGSVFLYRKANGGGAAWRVCVGAYAGTIYAPLIPVSCLLACLFAGKSWFETSACYHYRRRHTLQRDLEGQQQWVC
ncbi:MAG: hypothetical protein ACFFDI_26030 [Promethearchaeota archaeon]